MQIPTLPLSGRAVLLALVCVVADPAGAAETPKAVEVRITRPARGEVIRYVTVPGAIRANQQATLFAKVPGYLKSITVDKGDRVQAGQLLAEIEVPELLADATRYQAEVRVAEAVLSRLNAARSKAPDLVMPQAVDEAQGRFDIARANLERTETLLRYTKITAPFAGIVTARAVDPGAFIPVPTSGSTTPSASIVTLADFSTVRAQAALPEIDAALVQSGQPVKFTVEGLPGKTYEAQVSRIGFALDEATRTMLVEADVPNPDLSLRPGMYSTVRIGVERHENTLHIPVEALVMEKVNAFTFVIVDGKAKKTPLKLGFNDGAKVEVLSGLSGSEQVVLVGKMTLADGALVNAVEAK